MFDAEQKETQVEIKKTALEKESSQLLSKNKDTVCRYPRNYPWFLHTEATFFFMKNFIFLYEDIFTGLQLERLQLDIVNLYYMHKLTLLCML